MMMLLTVMVMVTKYDDDDDDDHDLTDYGYDSRRALRRKARASSSRW
jgi:aryl carrier-like protein